MNTRVQQRRIFASFLTSVLLLVAPWAAHADDWEWTVAPYFWAADVGLDLTVEGDPTLGVTVPFNEILQKLDSSIMARFEARNGPLGLYFDLIYLSLSDSSVKPLNTPGPILGDVLVESDLTLKLYDLGAFWRLGSTESGGVAFDLMAGARIVDMDVNTLITLPGPAMTEVDASAGPSETDLMLGARALGEFADRWSWMLRGDVSFGGTEGTLNASALVGYTFGEDRLFSLHGGYRHMQLEIKGMTPASATADYELSMSGPLLGFVFTF